jgi:hypothetical protein
MFQKEEWVAIASPLWWKIDMVESNRPIALHSIVPGITYSVSLKLPLSLSALTPPFTSIK